MGVVLPTAFRIPTQIRISKFLGSEGMGTATETFASTDQTAMFPFETEGLVVQEAKADFNLEPITLDEVRSDEVLVEMRFSGICHTVRLLSRP